MLDVAIIEATGEGTAGGPATARRLQPPRELPDGLENLIYQQENLSMAYTMEDFLRETHELVLEDALERRDPEDILKHYDAEERLKGLDPEERLKGLDPAIIKAWLAKQGRDH